MDCDVHLDSRLSTFGMVTATFRRPDNKDHHPKPAGEDAGGRLAVNADSGCQLG
jgi:hypothetical protein